MRALEQALREIKPLDEKAMAAARARQDTLTKPLGSLGRLEELSIKLAGIRGKPIPRIKGVWKLAGCSSKISQARIGAAGRKSSDPTLQSTCSHRQVAARKTTPRPNAKRNARR